MPELPEVETTRRGIAPHIQGRRLNGAVVRQPKLRYEVPAELDRYIEGRIVEAVERRGKYLLLRFDRGGLLIHLGMSGSLRLVPADSPPRTHDHLDILFEGRCLRFHDPRRFGLVLWSDGDPADHPLLARLGPEPLSDGFSVDYLQGIAAHRRIAVKSLIMDSHIVVGVGNIYANEALFVAGIHPLRRSDRIAAPRYGALVDAIRAVLSRALEEGGTTLRDFVREDGEPGYFAQQLKVYGRTGEPCPACGAPIAHRIVAQRSTYYCPRCQR